MSNDPRPQPAHPITEDPHRTDHSIVDNACDVDDLEPPVVEELPRVRGPAEEAIDAVLARLRQGRRGDG